MLTDTQKTEFYDGFVEALKWSSGGESDYSEAPNGYVVDQRGKTFFVFKTGEYAEPLISSGFFAQRAAIIAAWEDSGEEPPTLDGLDDYELAPITAQRLREYCNAWCDVNAELLNQYARQRDGKTPGCASVWEHAGHDFALTANGHGAGFWDRGLDELGDQLTAAATADYREPPTGWFICPEWYAVKHSKLGDVATKCESRIAATMHAWQHSGQTPPECLGAVFGAHIGDDGLVYVAGFVS